MSRYLLPLCLALACNDDGAGVPADCTRDTPVQLIPGSFSGDYLGDWSSNYDAVRRVGDTTFFNLRRTVEGFATYAGRACGADPVLLGDGMRLLPTRVALDPLDDDPTLVCDQDNGAHFRVDLAGRRAPQLLLPYLSCRGRPTKYGALFIGGWGYLRLFAEYPDESTATPLREDGGNDVFVLDEWIVYTHASDLHAYEFATGETIDLPGKVLGMTGSGDHVLWYDYEDIATVTLVDLRTREAAILGTFDRDAAWAADQYIPDFSYSTWDFDPSGRFVYHIFPGVPPEAFDLTGARVALPAPGEVIRLLDDGVVSVDRADGQVYFTRPRDEAPTALDARLTAEEGRGALQPVADHLEQLVGGDLVRVDLDGSPARALATGVSVGRMWIGERILVTRHDDGVLERIDTATGERTRLAGDVDGIEVVGAELYFVRRESADPADDGLWYLSPAALGVSEEVVERSLAPVSRPARHLVATSP